MAERAPDHDRRTRFDALFAAHFAAVQAYVVRRSGGAPVDDVLPETFLVAWRRLEAVPEDALPWLLGVARRPRPGRRPPRIRVARRLSEPDQSRIALLLEQRRQLPPGDLGPACVPARVRIDARGRTYAAYRMTLVIGPALGGYYAVQGTTWTDPPILSKPTRTVLVNGRRLLEFYNGADLSLVAWKTFGGA